MTVRLRISVLVTYGVKHYKSNEDGVSAAVCLLKGNKILCSCGCELIEHPFNVVAEGQMKECPRIPGCGHGFLCVSVPATRCDLR